jgi:hypothetical protein
VFLASLRPLVIRTHAMQVVIDHARCLLIEDNLQQ